MFSRSFPASSLPNRLAVLSGRSVTGIALLTAPVALALLSTAAYAAGPGGTTLAKNSPAQDKPVVESSVALEHEAEHLLTKDDAIRLAEQHLTLRNNRWGHPTEVKEDSDNYIVVFNTPEQETQLIGKRAVTVDKQSGLVQLRDRR